MVGIDAKRSDAMLNRIAILPTPVIFQSRSPITDKNPQTRSRDVIFQYAFLFTNDEIKTSKGIDPKKNIGSADKPTPCFISAKKAIRGAKDHKSHVTLFGLTFPCSVSATYPILPMIKIKAAR